jgi:hypothetical protein
MNMQKIHQVEQYTGLPAYVAYHIQRAQVVLFIVLQFLVERSYDFIYYRP